MRTRATDFFRRPVPQKYVLPPMTTLPRMVSEGLVAAGVVVVSAIVMDPGSGILKSAILNLKFGQFRRGHHARVTSRCVTVPASRAAGRHADAGRPCST